MLVNVSPKNIFNMGKERGSYSRRKTEISRDEMREREQLNRIDIHEELALEETLRSCKRFHAERGLASGSLSNDFRRIEVKIRNLKEKPIEEAKWKKKEQDPFPTKSLKAAQIREVVMAARRAGLISKNYAASSELPMVEWLDDENL